MKIKSWAYFHKSVLLTISVLFVWSRWCRVAEFICNGFDSLSEESNIEEEMSKFFSTSHHNHVLDGLNDNDILCDYYGHRVATFRKNRWYIIFYHFFSDLFLVKVIPWLTVIAFNTKVYIASRKFRQMRQRLLNRTEDVRGKFITLITKTIFATLK